MGRGYGVVDMVFDPDGTCSYQTATVGSYHEDTSLRRCPLADLVSRFRGELGVAAPDGLRCIQQGGRPYGGAAEP